MTPITEDPLQMLGFNPMGLLGYRCQDPPGPTRLTSGMDTKDQDPPGV